MELTPKQFFRIVMLLTIAHSILIVALFWQTSYLHKEIKALKMIGVGDNISCIPAADEGCEPIRNLK